MTESSVPLRSIPHSDPVDAVVTVPGSKSLTNRALLIAALASGESVLRGALDSEDTRIMADALRQIGVPLEMEDFDHRIHLSGESLLSNNPTGAKSPRPDFNPEKTTDLYVGNSGTTARFLTAALSFLPGRWRILGKERMYSRPIGDLIDALSGFGAVIETEREKGYPPLLIQGKRLPGGKITVRGGISSQFLSGLLMAAPLADGDVTIQIEGELVSRPYVEMTLAVMKSFGVEVITDEEFRSFRIPADSSYRGTDYAVEPDASAASYFFALPAIVGGRTTVRGLSKGSLQGDVDFVEILEAMGCHVTWGTDGVTVERPIRNGRPLELNGVDVDMNDISDTVQTLSVVALFAATPTRIRNVAHIRGKETDRISAVVTELRKFGIRVDEFPDGLQIWPDRTRIHGAQIATYDDHRMAMSFSLAGLAVPGVTIENPDCVVKTYPRFFEDLEKVIRK